MVDTKRIQVTVSDLEYRILSRCSEEIGVSVSALLGGFVRAYTINEADCTFCNPFSRDLVENYAIERKKLLYTGSPVDYDLTRIGGDFIGRV